MRATFRSNDNITFATKPMKTIGMPVGTWPEVAAYTVLAERNGRSISRQEAVEEVVAFRGERSDKEYVYAPLYIRGRYHVEVHERIEVTDGEALFASLKRCIRDRIGNPEYWNEMIREQLGSDDKPFSSDQRKAIVATLAADHDVTHSEKLHPPGRGVAAQLEQLMALVAAE